MNGSEGRVSDLEKQLADLDAELEAAQRTGKAVIGAITRTRAAVKTGRVHEIIRGLTAISQQIAASNEAAARLGNAWTFDIGAYMSDGRFLADLQEAAAERGLRLFEKDGRIYCFPLLLRVQPGDAAVKIGKSLERRIRPNALAGLLASLQKRPQRFREDQFLELLQRTWRQLAGANTASGPAPVVGLADIHDTLTLLPGSDYPIEEFARDLLLLDRKPDLRTRDGSRIEFPASTISKGRMRRLVVYDENGAERTYLGVRFVRAG
jgi:hypothetical protein